MTSNELTFSEIEWRSYAVMAEAGQTIVRVAQQSQIAQRARREFLQAQIYFGIRSMSGLLRDLLDIYHAPDAILALEAASPEQLIHTTESMRDIHSKVEQTIARIHPTRYWRSFYRPFLKSLKAYNDELATHACAFEANNSALILLTKKDQDHLVDSLLNPSRPNDTLREFVRK
jgi:hypothetical protein